jgi:hypothetical protein
MSAHWGSFLPWKLQPVRPEIMSYEITWEPLGVVKRFYDHLTGDDLKQTGMKLHGDERFDDILYVINDFLGVTEVSVTEADVEEINAIDNAASYSNRKLKLTVVATDERIIELARQYANSPDNVHLFGIFSTIDAARKWLGVRVP